MELRQLEYFREIADTGSINEAARRLNMSQPPLSYQIMQLESELNVSLFERSSKGVTLTEAGKLLYDRSGELLSYAESTKLEVSKSGRTRVLKLGITSTTVGTIMPYISKFVKKNPDVNFEIHDGMTYSLLNYLLDGIIDVSVVRTPLRLDGVEAFFLAAEPMIAVSSPKMRADNEEEIKLCELTNQPLIIYRRYEKLILGEFRAQNIEPDIFCVCDDARDALLWAKEGLATAIFPQSMSIMCSELRIQTIKEKNLETQIALIWRKGKKPPHVVKEFLDTCKSGN